MLFEFSPILIILPKFYECTIRTCNEPKTHALVHMHSVSDMPESYSHKAKNLVEVVW